MSSLILIPFSIFFLCCLLQFWFLKQVRDRLIEHHPETFLKVEKSSIFPMNGLWKFTRKGRHKALGDAELDRHVRNLKRLMLVGFAAWLGCAAALFTTISAGVPKLPLGIANGSYSNSCCGTLFLADGRMTVLGERISYVIESDKEGSYVLPSLYVGTSPKGFLVRDGFPLKLRLNDDAHPTSIELINDADGSVFVFQRLPGR